MANCKNCNANFKVPELAIEVIQATYCPKCIGKGLKKYLSLSKEEAIASHAKEVGLC